jgi:hypothetical protein
MDGPEKKKSSCLFTGCLVGSVLFILALGFGGFSLYRGYQSFAPMTDKFLVSVDNDDFKTAYSMAGSKWQAAMNSDQFTEFESSMKMILGKHVSTSMASMNISNVNGSSTARVIYNTQFTNGPATLTFSLEEEGGEWKVQGLHYGSELIVKAMICPACKTQHAALSKFCSQCGKPMNLSNSAPAEAPAPK